MDELEQAPKVARAGRRARQYDEAPQDSAMANSLAATSPTADEQPSTTVGFMESGGGAQEEQQDRDSEPGSPGDGPPTAPQGPSGEPAARVNTLMTSTSGAASTGGAAGEPADPNRKYGGFSRRKQEQQIKEQEQHSQWRSKYEERAQDAGIIDIPELEEEGKEDLTRVVAEAPKVRSNKVQGIHELDDDQQYRLPSTLDNDIDLSILTRVLCSSEQVYEADEVWDPDMLFAAVASELNKESEKGAAPAEPDVAPTNELVQPSST